MSASSLNMKTVTEEFNRDDYGRFFTEGEANTGKLTVRVPPSLEEKVKSIAGKDLSAWLRKAILNELQREEKAC